MTAAILLAPATRIGYLLYPINFFVWAPLLRGADQMADSSADGPAGGPADAGVAAGRTLG